MAWVYDFAITEGTVASAATGDANMPEHQADDMLVVLAAKDGTGALTYVAGSGYTALSSGAGGAQWVGAWYKRATTSTEAAPAFTLTSDEYNIVVVAVRGAHTSTAPTSAISTDDNTMSGGGYLVDQTLASTANGIILFGAGTDSGMGVEPMPGFGQILYAGDAGTTGCGVWWQYFKAGSVSTSTYRCFGAIADNCRTVKVLVPDDGNNTYEPGRIDLTSTFHTLYGGPWGGTTLVAPDTTWTHPVSLSIAMLGTDFDQVWTDNGSAVFTDETVDARDDGAGDVAIANNNNTAIYFGSNTTFNSLCIDVGTAAVGASVGAWQYSTGSGGWSTLTTIDRPNATSWASTWLVAGLGTVTFTAPANWAKNVVNTDAGDGFYYVRRVVSDNWATSGPTLDQVLKNGRPLLYDASTGTADSGVNPYHLAYSATPAAGTATTYLQHSGGEFVATSAPDWSSGYLLTTFNLQLPRDLIDLGFYDLHKGAAITLMDANAENRRTSWIVSAKDSPDQKAAKRKVIGIQPSQTTDTAWARHGALGTAAVDTFLGTSSAPFGATACTWSLLIKAGNHILSGGTSALPLTFEQAADALVKGANLFPVWDVNGGVVDIWHPTQFGGGDDLHIDLDLKTFQFPTRASASEKTTQWHVDDNQVGFDFNGQSGDTIKFTNCLFTGVTPYYWRLNASANSGATWDFGGSTVVGATVTLRSVYTFTNMTFNNCSEIALNGADITDSTIRDTRATTSQGAVAITSAGEGDGIDRITFTDNNDGDIGHSIRITATGTYTFDGHQFSGGGPAERSFNTTTGVDAGTDIVTVDSAHGYADGDAIYYQDQGGAQNMGLTDGTLYYVNSQTSTTLSFHTTKAAAIADTGKIALTSAGGETHYIYSAKADVYNNSGGAVTINLTNGAGTPTIRESNSSSTTVQNLVTVKVTVKDANTLAIVADGARVLLEADSVETGSHTGSDNAATLTDSSQSFTVDALIGYRIYNTTDGSNGLITDNDATTVTATLSGGTQNDWDTSDAYIIVAKPALNPVSITRSGSTATVTHLNHGLATSDQVVIRGATEDGYNGIQTITVTGANAYTYTVGTPDTPATGSPTSSAVILSGTTTSGIVQTTTFNYTISQPITGKVRRATTGALYKTGAITGTITSTGLDTTVLLITDE